MDRKQIIGYAVLLYFVVAFIVFQAIWGTPPWLTLLRVLSIPVSAGGVAIAVALLAVALVLVVGVAWLCLLLCMLILFPIPLVIWLITRVNLFAKWGRVYDLMDDKFEGSSGAWLFLPFAGLLGIIDGGMLWFCVCLWIKF